MRTVNGFKVMLQAHRGVSTDYPENTMAAFQAAVEQGYDIIELDPKFTSDNVCVVLHDRTLDRTARKNGGAAVPGTKISEIPFEEADSYEYGSWFSEKFAGEPIPLFENVLLFAKEAGIPLKIDNVIEKFTPEQTEILFSLIEKTGMERLAGFTCTKPDYLAAVTARFPDAPIHYDGLVDEEKLETVRALLKNNPLTVWLPFPNRLTSWCKMPPVSAERAAMIEKLGAKMGVWILEDECDMEAVAAEFKPDVIETTGSLKPNR